MAHEGDAGGGASIHAAILAQNSGRPWVTCCTPGVYDGRMLSTDGVQAGFIYAALACDDADLSAASAGISPELLHALREKVPPVGQRRGALPGLLQHFMRPLPSPERVLPRLRGLVAARLAPAEARPWIAGTPMPRPGFRAPADLLNWARSHVEALVHTPGESDA
jgi:hypothetical protein